MAQRLRATVSAAALGLALLLLYMPVAARLVRQWWSDPDYSHGFVVAPLACWLIWSRRQEIARAGRAPRAIGLAICIGAMALLTLGILGAELFLTRISFLIFVVGAIVFVLGWRSLRPLAFPLALLVLTIPVPAIVVSRVTLSLQLMASTGAEVLLRTAGVAVLREGNVLVLSNATLQVAEACSGIRSLLALVTLGLLVARARGTRWPDRSAIIASAIPIAVLVNAGRVAASAFAAHWYGRAVVEGVVHDALGWLMFLVAFGLLAAVARTLAALGPGRTADGQPARADHDAVGIIVGKIRAGGGAREMA
jgi:exosortase